MALPSAPTITLISTPSRVPSTYVRPLPAGCRADAGSFAISFDGIDHLFIGPVDRKLAFVRSVPAWPVPADALSVPIQDMPAPILGKRGLARLGQVRRRRILLVLRRRLLNNRGPARRSDTGRIGIPPIKQLIKQSQCDQGKQRPFSVGPGRARQHNARLAAPVPAVPNLASNLLPAQPRRPPRPPPPEPPPPPSPQPRAPGTGEAACASSPSPAAQPPRANRQGDFAGSLVPTTARVPSASPSTPVPMLFRNAPLSPPKARRAPRPAAPTAAPAPPPPAPPPPAPPPGAAPPPRSPAPAAPQAPPS